MMLLATDLDGTFLAGDPENRQSLYQLISSHPDITLVFVTGRGLEAVMPLLSDPGIPTPHYIICDVGCTVVHGTTLEPVQPLQVDIDRRWPGDRVITDAVSHIQGLQRQEVPQTRRCSFFCTEDAITDELRHIVEQLGCDLLYSANHYLDVLPPGTNKGSTLKALVAQLDIAPGRVLVAGDTLNDLSMFQHDFLGVCVGSSEQALLEATSGSARVLHARQEGCGGILEAISYFGFMGPAGLEAEARNLQSVGKSDLVIVYHRLPYEETVRDGRLVRHQPKSPNGIIPTLLSFFADGKPGSWVAWAVDDPACGAFERYTTVDQNQYPGLVVARVPLTKSDVDIFYKQFSKEAFWPTLHTFWERAVFRDEHWQVFQKVNRAFAQCVAEEAAEGATVWIHDYNLWMVPAFLREKRPDLVISFFHHTYFPSADVFNVLPWRRDIIGSLLQCDYVGFHIPRQAENFVDVARGVAPITVSRTMHCAPRFLTYGCAVGLDEMTTEIEVHGRRIGLGAHPVGLDIGRVRAALDRGSVRQRMSGLRDEFAGVRVIFSVERLDYTKGILEKLQAYELLLEEYPELVGNVSLLVVCVPAAREMRVYDELRTHIEQAVGRINGQFSRIGWMPVQFFFRSFPFEELVACYAMADVMWVTPLRDGLNLVAKEYVATQGLIEGSGVLVLSEFTGAAAELHGAVLANPHDVQELVRTCYFALTMGRDEARQRLRELFDVVSYNDIAHWGREFLQSVDEYSGARLEVDFAG